jgi:hypothetical protein
VIIKILHPYRKAATVLMDTVPWLGDAHLYLP